jgi:hypothetical protein
MVRFRRGLHESAGQDGFPIGCGLVSRSSDRQLTVVLDVGGWHSAARANCRWHADSMRRRFLLNSRGTRPQLIPGSLHRPDESRACGTPVGVPRRTSASNLTSPQVRLHSRSATRLAGAVVAVCNAVLWRLNDPEVPKGAERRIWKRELAISSPLR